MNIPQFFVQVLHACARHSVNIEHSGTKWARTYTNCATAVLHLLRAYMQHEFHMLMYMNVACEFVCECDTCTHAHARTHAYTYADAEGMEGGLLFKGKRRSTRKVSRR
jgi:hypothetical protein